MASFRPILLALVVIIGVTLVSSESLLEGVTDSGFPVYIKNVQKDGKVLKVQTKDFFWENKNGGTIKGIRAQDLDNSIARATITGGGVGYHFVSIHFASPPGRGLNYQVLIYA